jgi:hypothetical protein
VLDSAWPYVFVGALFLVSEWLGRRVRRRSQLRRTPIEVGWASVAVAAFVFSYLGGSLTGMALSALWFAYNLVLFWTRLRGGDYR